MRNRRNRFRSNVNNLDTLHIIKLILEILIVIFLLIFVFSSIKVKQNVSKSAVQIAESNEINDNSNSNTNTNTSNVISNNNNSKEQNKIDEPQSTTIHMALTGDIMCHNTIYKDAYNSETESYDFSYIFEDIKYNIQTADIAVR